MGGGERGEGGTRQGTKTPPPTPPPQQYIPTPHAPNDTGFRRIMLTIPCETTPSTTPHAVIMGARGRSWGRCRAGRPPTRSSCWPPAEDMAERGKGDGEARRL